jgi:crotonobetainyl-CoA:carnitine CoA-transferase CaiB-like acyl-CoA transferase
LARRLVLASDIVVENYRPGVLARLGLDADQLRREKPALIWCSISGFGQSGPYREKPAYDMIVQALSGGMSLTGEPDGLPVRAGIPIGDLAAGLYGTIGVLAAINRRHSTGRGDFIDISMLDCQAAMLCYQAAYFLHSGNIPGRQGRGHDSIATYRAFRAGDGVDLVVTAITERMWAGLCRVLGCTELIEDERFRSNQDRYDNRAQLWPILEEAFLHRSADEWAPLLEREGIPVGVVNTLDRVVSDPQIQDRGMVIDVRAEDGRAVRMMGNPILMADTDPVATHYPPGVGEHSCDVLRNVLNLQEHEIEGLIARRAVRAG